MPGLHELNVSLTKNGYFKVADVIAKHPRHEVLDNIRGTYTGINLDRAQIASDDQKLWMKGEAAYPG
jgi:hypothetical protein